MNPTPDSDITCPLCGQTDFDRIGFLNHIERGYCNAIPEVREAEAFEAVALERMRKEWRKATK